MRRQHYAGMTTLLEAVVITKGDRVRNWLSISKEGHHPQTISNGSRCSLPLFAAHGTFSDSFRRDVGHVIWVRPLSERYEQYVES